LKLEPENVEAFSRRGLVRHRQRQHALAIEDFSRAIALAPESYLYVNRAYSLELSGDFKAAPADYRRAAELDPKNSDVLVGRANLRVRLGDATGAIENYGRYLKAQPDDAMGYESLLEGKSEEARTHLEWVKTAGQERYAEYSWATRKLRELPARRAASLKASKK
jgi:tetratricopeptide (TPR) repeat protein